MIFKKHQLYRLPQEESRRRLLKWLKDDEKSILGMIEYEVINHGNHIHVVQSKIDPYFP